MTDTTATPPSTPTLGDVLGKIDALIATQTGVTQMDAAAFQTHVAAELEKSLSEATSGKAELSKARLAHLKAQVELAKAIFDTGAVLAAVTLFKDPWQTLPNTSATKSEADLPGAIPPSGDSNIQIKEDVLFVTTTGADGVAKRAPSSLLKALVIVSKATPASPAHKALVAKGASGVTIIQKAGEAKTILANIATMFGIVLEDPDDILKCDFRWDVGDTITALQSAAKLEGVMSGMSAMLTGGGATPAAKSAGAPPAAPAVPPVAPATEAAITSGDEPWPTDLAASVLDEKTGLQKAADSTLYWGRDSEKPPTTV